MCGRLGRRLCSSRAITPFRGRQVDLPNIGNVSTQAARERNTRSEVAITYAIWHVSNLRVPLLPAILITTATENNISLVVGLHRRLYGYEVFGTQVHLLGDYDADQADLTARVVRQVKILCGCVSGGQTQRFVIFALVDALVRARRRSAKAAGCSSYSSSVSSNGGLVCRPLTHA